MPRVSLLERAATLVPPDELDLALEIELGEALFWTGRADDALRRADLLAERAAATGDRVGEISGRIKAGVLRLNLRPEGATEELAASIQRALPELEAAGDHLALYIAYSALAEVALAARTDGHGAGSLRTGLRACSAGRPRADRGSSGPSPRIATSGRPLRPISSSGSTRTNPERRGTSSSVPTAPWRWRCSVGVDEARAILAEARADQSERGGGTLLANLLAFECVDLELWAGDPTAAAEFGAEGFRLHEEMGNRDFLAPAAGNLARAFYALDRLDEAERWAAPLGGARFERRRLEGDDLAAGQGQGARSPWRARRGGAARP